MAKSNSSPMFRARKGDRTQYFTELQWELLGKNKEGWVRESDQTVTAEEAKKPETGEKVKPIVVIPEKKDEVPVQTVTAEGDKAQTQTVEGDKEAFLKAAEGLTKNPIKNFFDKNEQKYDKKADLDTLKNQLGEYLGWDINKLSEI